MARLIAPSEDQSQENGSIYCTQWGSESREWPDSLYSQSPRETNMLEKTITGALHKCACVYLPIYFIHLLFVYTSVIMFMFAYITVSMWLFSRYKSNVIFHEIYLLWKAELITFVQTFASITSFLYLFFALKMFLIYNIWFAMWNVPIKWESCFPFRY